MSCHIRKVLVHREALRGDEYLLSTLWATRGKPGGGEGGAAMVGLVAVVMAAAGCDGGGDGGRGVMALATLSCGMCCFDETASDCLNDRIAASRLPCIIEYCIR